MLRALKTATAAAVACGLAASPAVAADVVPNRVIVKYEKGASAETKREAADSAGVTRSVGRVAGVGARVVAVEGNAAAAAERLDEQPGVAYAEPDEIIETQSVPNDPRFGELYALQNSNDADIDAPEAWSTVFGPGNFPASGGATVGIVDSGIDTDHPDLAGKVDVCSGVRSASDPALVQGSCEDEFGHGTHVAGTIGALTNNGVGVAGVAPNARLAVCKALDNLGRGSTTGVASCIDYLVGQGADIVSLSLGGNDSQTLQAAAQRAYNNGDGALVVAAAGNDGSSRVLYPAGYPEVVSVAATDSNDRRASFSNYNDDVEIAAPGARIVSTGLDGGYTTMSGTSMAAPHVAGAAALLLSREPALSAAQLRDRLTRGAVDLGTGGRDPEYGFGRLDLRNSIG